MIAPLSTVGGGLREVQVKKSFSWKGHGNKDRHTLQSSLQGSKIHQDPKRKQRKEGP